MSQHLAPRDPPFDSRRRLLKVSVLGTAGCLLGGLAGTQAAAAPPSRLPQARPEELGLDPRRLQAAYDLLERWTTGPDAPVPGGAILVGRSGKTVPPRFFGRQGPERDAPPLRRDGLFLLASITKPITYLGALLLVERGQLNLNDPVTRYVPEFAAHGKGAVLVHHLFTHTSGLPEYTARPTERPSPGAAPRRGLPAGSSGFP